MRLIGLVILALSLILAPLAAEAQQVGKAPKIAYVLANIPEADITGPQPNDRYTRTFLETMRELGWVDGQNIMILRKSAEGHPDRYGALARELVNLKMDVIVASGQVAFVVRQVTDTIPIVSIGGVTAGRQWGVESLARPGANVTGLSSLSGSALIEKRLQLLKEAVPKISRVAFLSDSGTTLAPHAAARVLSLKLVPVAVDTPDGLQRAFGTITNERVDAVFIHYGRFFWAHRSAIIDFAAKQRLPTSFPYDIFARDGGLMSYGPNFVDINRRSATYVDKILKGARPGDLPIEQPNTLEFVINLKTAKAIGLTIPQSVLQRADQVIQ